MIQDMYIHKLPVDILSPALQVFISCELSYLYCSLQQNEIFPPC